MLGWSHSKPSSPPKPMLQRFSWRLCELITAFHINKGNLGPLTFMGSNITRNSVLVLNHLLGEMQFVNVKVSVCYHKAYVCNVK